MSAPATTPTLDGRTFAPVARAEGGEVGPGTVFAYQEADGAIWATYSGGAVRRGFLVGTRDGDILSFRYAQLNHDGQTSTGRCVSTITVTETGRLRLDEEWAWESRRGSGTSSVEEID